MSETNSVQNVETAPSLPTSEYEMRKHLNALSKEIYGTSSKWQKLVNKGVAERREPTPDNKATHSTRRPSLAEVYEHMVTVKREHEAKVLAFKAALEEAEAKRILENNLSGSVKS